MWDGARTADRKYGVVFIEGHLFRVHHLGYLLKTGKLPRPREHVTRSCMNSLCWEPNHCTNVPRGLFQEPVFDRPTMLPKKLTDEQKAEFLASVGKAPPMPQTSSEDLDAEPSKWIHEKPKVEEPRTKAGESIRDIIRIKAE